MANCAAVTSSQWVTSSTRKCWSVGMILYRQRSPMGLAWSMLSRTKAMLDLKYQSAALRTGWTPSTLLYDVSICLMVSILILWRWLMFLSIIRGMNTLCMQLGETPKPYCRACFSMKKRITVRHKSTPPPTLFSPSVAPLSRVSLVLPAHHLYEKWWLHVRGVA